MDEFTMVMFYTHLLYLLLCIVGLIYGVFLIFELKKLNKSIR